MTVSGTKWCGQSKKISNETINLEWNSTELFEFGSNLEAAQDPIHIQFNQSLMAQHKIIQKTR